jgi:hypothetical protein
MTFFVDANNTNLAVENVLIDSNATLNSDNVNVNATNTKIRDDQLRSRRRNQSDRKPSPIMAAAIKLTGAVTFKARPL